MNESPRPALIDMIKGRRAVIPLSPLLIKKFPLEEADKLRHNVFGDDHLSSRVTLFTFTRLNVGRPGVEMGALELRSNSPSAEVVKQILRLRLVKTRVMSDLQMMSNPTTPDPAQ